MRYIILLILLLPIFAQAQTKTPFATTPTPIANRFAYTNNGLWVDSAVRFINYRNTPLVGFDANGYMIPGAAFDSTGIYNALADSMVVIRDSLATIRGDIPNVSGFVTNVQLSDSTLAIRDALSDTAAAIRADIPVTSFDTLANYLQIFSINKNGAIPNDGIDDTEPIQTTINEAVAAGGGWITGINGVYDLMDTLVKNANGRNPNSQIYIPFQQISPTDSTSTHITLKIGGQTIPSYFEGGLNDANTEHYKGGMIWRSHANADGSYLPCVIRAVPGDTISPFGIPLALNAIEWETENLTILTKHDVNNGGTQISGIDYYFSPSMQMNNVRVGCDTSIWWTIEPTRNVFGVRGNVVGSATSSTYRNVFVTGAYKHGIVAYEHNNLGQGVQVFGCKYGIETGAANYPIKLDGVLVQWCQYLIHTGDYKLGSQAAQTKITGTIEAETFTSAFIPKWYARGHVDIADSLNLLVGNLRYNITLNGNTSDTMRRYGAQYLTLKYENSITGGTNTVDNPGNTRTIQGSNLYSIFFNKYTTGTQAGRFYLKNQNSGGITQSMVSSNDSASHLITMHGTNENVNFLIFGGGTDVSGQLLGGRLRTNVLLLGTIAKNGVHLFGSQNDDSITAGINTTLKWGITNTTMFNNGDFTNNGNYILNGTQFSTSSTAEAISLINNVDGRGGYLIRNRNTGGNAVAGIRADVSAGGSSFGDFYHGGTNNTQTIAGLGIAHKTVVIDNGATNDGLILATATSDPIYMVTNSTIRATWGATGNLSLATKISNYNGSAPLNGEILIAHTANGTFEKATLTQGTNMAITNGAGSISLATSLTPTFTNTTTTLRYFPVTTEPAAPATGGVMWSETGGTLKYKKADGSVTTLVP